MKCLVRTDQRQRSGSTPGKTKEESGQDAYHSAQSLHDDGQSRSDRILSRMIKWPTASNKGTWQEFDTEVCSILDTTSKGDADRRIQTLTKIILSYASSKFGLVDRCERKAHTNNRRTERIKQLRQELRSLKKRFKKASSEERQPLAELREIVRKKLMTIRRAEGHRRRRKERARKRTAFITNPFGFAKNLLGDKRNGQLNCTANTVNAFLHDTLKDPEREENLGHNEQMIQPESPTTDFNMKEPSWKEIQDVVRAARTASAPGPSGVTYCVYKRCPGILNRLWRIMRKIWRRGKIAQQWRFAEGVWIPKEENSERIDQFRSISLLSTECKIFFSILSRRLSNYLLANKYIDTAVQKGGIAGIPGCIEHSGSVTQLLREARESKGDLAVLWLDLANAYGSMPHKLVEFALTSHHVPSKVASIILDYYENFKLRISSKSVTSDWHRLERGIITGCTISATLFALAMNMIAKAAEKECRGPMTKSGIRLPPIRAYMDDLTVTTASVTGCRWIVRGLEKHITWARMKFKPSKSRSVVLKRGKVENKFRFCIAGEIIPTLSEKPVKSLGKVFHYTLKDKVSIEGTSSDLMGWLKRVDRSGLPGRFKAWIYQHAILPRILWPLLMYSVPMSTVESLERTINSFLRRWLGLPRSLSSTALYGTSNALQMPFKGLVEEFKVSRTREAIMYRNSKDPKVAKAGIEIRTGRKWSATDELRLAEERQRVKKVIGTVAEGTRGLGYDQRSKYGKSINEQQSLLQEVREGVEEERITKMVGFGQQGSWTKWEKTTQRRITWPDLLHKDFGRTKFLVQAVYDTLPSPVNLHIWGKTDTPTCHLCSGSGTLQHILSGCPRALSEGRYRWRHDKVLAEIAGIFKTAISNNKYDPNGRTINFVKAGEKPPTQQKTRRCMLSSAPDWQLEVDLVNRLTFPAHISKTSLRPDIVLYSNRTKQVILFELSVPWEENMEVAHERKAGKYHELVQECKERGWRASCHPIEIGARGFAGVSLSQALNKIGVGGTKKRKATQVILESAERATRWIWICRSRPWVHIK